MLRKSNLLMGSRLTAIAACVLCFSGRIVDADVIRQAALKTLSEKESKKLGAGLFLIGNSRITDSELKEIDGGVFAKRYAIDTKGGEPLFHVVVVVRGGASEFEGQLKMKGIRAKSFRGNTLVIRATFKQIVQVAKLKDVAYVELLPKARPLLDHSVPRTNADLSSFLEYTSGITNGGQDVMVGIVDTGIDWAHGDFIDNDTGQSRILFLLDQVDAMEYTQADINNEIDGTPGKYVRIVGWTGAFVFREG